jgi:phosphoglycerol transferase MdoB-like AlkP superfamily enzyme
MPTPPAKPLPTQVAKSSSQFGGTLSILGVAFVVLKLTHVIDWSWWLVTLPFYGPTAALLAIAAVLFVIGGFFLSLSKIFGGGK